MPFVKTIRPQKIRRGLSLKEFYEKRNKVLIIRAVGGLGDILMHRMIFEDFKLLAPEIELHFACPWQYHDAVRDHPFVDKIFNTEYNQDDYIVHYNTSTACGRYEMRIAPGYDLHRSDIWASHCGLHLTKHDMHFNLTESEQAEGRKLIEEHRFCDGPSVIMSPISALTTKNIPDEELLKLANELKFRGFCPIAVHTAPIYCLLKNDFPTITPKLRQWLGIINQADYVISVDTAALHCAGGMRKPFVGIFTFVNGETYTKYYPTAEVVQSECPVGHRGCYNWGLCPKKSGHELPCHTNVNAKVVLESFDRLLERFPM